MKEETREKIAGALENALALADLGPLTEFEHRELVLSVRAALALLREDQDGQPQPEWRSFQDAPKDGRKIIMGSIAKFVPYKDPSKVAGKAGRWQVRDDYGKWRNCDLQADYWLDGYKVDAALPSPPTEGQKR